MNTTKRIYIDLDEVIIGFIGEVKINLVTIGKHYSDETYLINDFDSFSLM